MNAPALNPSVFNFANHPVRVVTVDGAPWFVASDVAEALGYRDAANAGRILADHQKADTQIVSTSPDGTEQRRSVTIINESGLYRLVLRSRKPEAERFSDWVTGEVLPAIRKTGRYEAAPQPARPVVLSLPGAGRYLVVVDTDTLSPAILDANQLALVRADHVSAVRRDLFTLRQALADMNARLALLQGEANPDVVEQPITVRLVGGVI